MMMTSTRSTTKITPVVGKVPRLSGTAFLPTSEPATAIAGTIMKNRPASMVRPRVTLYHSVLAFSPANAEPEFVLRRCYKRRGSR